MMQTIVGSEWKVLLTILEVISSINGFKLSKLKSTACNFVLIKLTQNKN